MVMLDENVIEDLVTVGAGYLSQDAAVRIAEEHGLGSHMLWVRVLNVAGTDTIVCKMTCNIEVLAAWQRRRCPQQVTEHMADASTRRQAYIMMAIRGMGLVGLSQGIAAIRVLSAPSVESEMIQDIASFLEESEESSGSTP